MTKLHNNKFMTKLLSRFFVLSDRQECEFIWSDITGDATWWCCPVWQRGLYKLHWQKLLWLMTSKTRIKNWWSKLESTRYEVTTSTYFAKIESNSKQVCSDNYLHLARSGAVGGPSGWAGARGGRASHHVAGSRGVGGSPRGARHLVAEAWGRGPLGGGGARH
jgi:hypothetical protein